MPLVPSGVKPGPSALLPTAGAISDLAHGVGAEALFRALLEAVPDAMVIVGADGVIKLVNAQAEVLFGYRRDELVGQSAEMLVPDGFRDGHPGHRDKYASRPRPRAMGSGLELYGRRKGGDDFPVEVRLSPLDTDEGLLVLVAVRDVADRNRAEARFRALLESSPDAVVIVGSDGVIKLVNTQTEKLFGYRRDELIGQPVEVMVPESLRALHERHRAAFSARPHIRMGPGLELRARRGDGSEFPAEISLGPLDLEEGPVVSATIRDVTERKKVEDQLAVQTAELARSNADLQQFAYLASHDLQEPLRHVSVFVDKLAESYQGALDERGRRYIGYVVDGAARMRQLIDGLLEFSRGRRSTVQLQPVDLATVFSAAALAVSVRAEEVNAVVAGPDLPQVLGDGDLLYRLFVNLLSNALKFGRTGRPPRIDVSARPIEKDWWEIVVSDNGIGIPPDSRELAFEVFGRLHGNDYPGTGIGLSVARRIVEAHGGAIGLGESAAGGTEVRFTLPGPARGQG